MIYILKYLGIIIGILVLFIIWYLYIKPVHASVNNDFSITICHHTPGNNVTLTFHMLQAYLGHLGTPHNGETFDTAGACSSPTPTASPTPQPTETPQPSTNPCDLIDISEVIKDQLVVPCPSPTDAPNATPSAQPASPQESGLSDPQGPFAAPSYSCNEIKEIPTILEVKRNNSTSVHVKWSPVDGFVNHYKIEYGLVTGIPLWNTVVEGTETDLNYLPFDHVLWLRVAGIDQGCLGKYSDWIDP